MLRNPIILSLAFLSCENSKIRENCNNNTTKKDKIAVFLLKRCIIIRTGGGSEWPEQVVDIFERITHSAQWKHLNAKSVDCKFGVRTVQLVDTNDNKVICFLDRSKFHNFVTCKYFFERF